jgi:hypothetical protein
MEAGPPVGSFIFSPNTSSASAFVTSLQAKSSLDELAAFAGVELPLVAPVFDVLPLTALFPWHAVMLSATPQNMIVTQARFLLPHDFMLVSRNLAFVFLRPKDDSKSRQPGLHQAFCPLVRGLQRVFTGQSICARQRSSVAKRFFHSPIFPYPGIPLRRYPDFTSPDIQISVCQLTRAASCASNFSYLKKEVL